MAKLGGVRSVGEMVKEPIDLVPSEYVRSPQELGVVSDLKFVPVIPVIDMQNLRSKQFGASELEKLHDACKNWGFFQLINHGVSEVLIEQLRSEIKDLFSRPLEEKKRLEGGKEGFGQVFKAVGDKQLAWGDTFRLNTQPKSMRKYFSKVPMPFRGILETYIGDVKSFIMELLELMAKVLNMDPNDMTSLFEEGIQNITANHYPPCPQPDLVIGLQSHTDGGGLTALLQLNQVDGLQIKKDGVWIPVKPLPNAFLILVGDMLEILTNGIYQSVEHRAMVNASKERLSIATFNNMKPDGLLGPAPSLITPKTPPKFKSMIVTDYLKDFFTRDPFKHRYIDTMRIDYEEKDD